MNGELGIKKLCEKYGIRPSKKLGQNFVTNAEVPRKMMEAAELNARDCVVEVGPGFGALTKEIAPTVKRVFAVEVDRGLFEAARAILAPYKNVGVVHGDILKMSNQHIMEQLSTPSATAASARTLTTPYHLSKVEKQPYKVVASLPYSITSAALRKFTEQEPRPSLIVVLVQKEVAERVCAPPGKMSVLSVAMQYYGRPEIIAVVPRASFWPEPEVESAILKISNIQYLISHIDAKHLFQIVRIGFSSRRKQLQNNLMAGLRLPREQVVDALYALGLKSAVRAQELRVENWIALSKKL